MGNFTILRARSGYATKRFHRDRKGNVRKTAYASLKWFAVESVDVAGIRDLAAVLARLERQPSALVVRGEPINGIDRTRARRLLHTDPDGSPATLRAESRPWVCVDLDKVPCPAATDAADDPEAAVEHLIGLLPQEFQDATCFWQLSSSQGFAGDTLSAHLWFWLDRPIADDELRRWAVALNRARGSKLVDPALFNPVQVHYTAAPIFDGVPDPLPRRSGLRQGLEDAVVLELPPASAVLVCGGGNGFDGSPPVGFAGFLEQIGTEAGFRQPIVSAIASYIASNGVDGTDATALKNAIREVVGAADPGGRSAEDIARYASDRYLDDVIRWVVGQERNKQPTAPNETQPEAANDGQETAPAAPTRKLLECPPAFQSRPRSAADATRELRAVMADWFDEASAHRSARAAARQAMTDVDAAIVAEAGCLESLDELFDEEARQKWEQERRRRRRQASEAIKRRHGIRAWKKSPRRGIQAAAGLGKTSVAAEEIARRPELWQLHVDIATPRIDLAQETAAKVRDAIFYRTPGMMFFGGPWVMTMRGRSQPNPETGEPMCARAKLAEKTAKLGRPVYSTLCSKKSQLPDGKPTLCPHYKDCPYLAQYRHREPAIRSYTHDHLALPRTLSLSRGDVLIVDESCLEVLISQTSFGLDRLLAARPYVDAAEMADLFAASQLVHDAMMAGSDLLAELRRRDATPEQMAAAAQAEDRMSGDSGLDVRPDMADAEIGRRLDAYHASESHKRARMFRQLAKELALPREVCHGVEVRRDVVMPNGERQDRVHVHYLRSLKVADDVPVLLLDADADGEINCRIWGEHAEHVPIAVERNAVVTQVWSARFSNSQLLADHPAASGKDKQDAARRRWGVAELVKRKVAERGRGLVVCNRKVRCALTGEKADGGKLQLSVDWHGATITHFGALRGRDAFKGLPWITVIGREQPPPDSIEGIARALWADDPEPLNLQGKYVDEPRGYRMRDGSQAGVAAQVHSDRRVQRVLELKRERETGQAVDRLRLVHRSRRADVTLLSSLPVDVTVDRLESWTESREGGNRYQKAWEAKRFLPLTARDLAQCFPELFVSEKAVECYAGRQGEIPLGLQIESYLKSEGYFQSAEYRRASARGRACRLVYDPVRYPTPEAAKAALEVALSAPLAMFRFLPSTVAETAGDAATLPDATEATPPAQEPAQPAYPIPTEDRAMPVIVINRPPPPSQSPAPVMRPPSPVQVMPFAKHPLGESEIRIAPPMTFPELAVFDGHGRHVGWNFGLPLPAEYWPPPVAA